MLAFRRYKLTDPYRDRFLVKGEFIVATLIRTRTGNRSKCLRTHNVRWSNLRGEIEVQNSNKSWTLGGLSTRHNRSDVHKSKFNFFLSFFLV